MKKEIIINLQFEGVHRWENADSIPEVSFLRYPHRHIFHATLKKIVSHNDRDIEIIKFKREVLKYLETFDGDFGELSCESIAEMLLIRFECSSVQILEDGENGAQISIN